MTKHYGNSRHFYIANGLSIDSCLELPELTRLSTGRVENFDVKIDFGEVPESLPNPVSSGIRFQAAPGEFLLRMENIASYWVRNGEKIIIKTKEGVEESEIRVFLLASAFGALAHQKGLFPIHASSIVHNDHAILFAGSSGLGKSTLAAHFYKKGYTVLADDITVVKYNEQLDTVVAFPGYQQLKLWEDTLLNIKEDKDQYKILRKGLNKYGYPISRDHLNPIPISRIYTLHILPGTKTVITELEGWNKFDSLKYQTFRQKLVAPFGRQKEHFADLDRVCKNVPIYNIERPSSRESLHDFFEILEEHFSSDINNEICE